MTYFISRCGFAPLLLCACALSCRGTSSPDIDADTDLDGTEAGTKASTEAGVEPSTSQLRDASPPVRLLDSGEPDSSLDAGNPGHCSDAGLFAICFGVVGRSPERPDEYTQEYDVRAVVTAFGSGSSRLPCQSFTLGEMNDAAAQELQWLQLESEGVEVSLQLAAPNFPMQSLLGRELRIRTNAWEHDYEGSRHTITILDERDRTLFWASDGSTLWAPVPLAVGAIECEYEQLRNEETIEFAHHALEASSADGELVSIPVGADALVDDRWLVQNVITTIDQYGLVEDRHASRVLWTTWLLDPSGCDAGTCAPR